MGTRVRIRGGGGRVEAVKGVGGAAWTGWSLSLRGGAGRRGRSLRRRSLIIWPRNHRKRCDFFIVAPRFCTVFLV